MTHADTLALPPEALESKTAFYAHVVEVLLPLLSPSPPPTVDHVAGNWVTSLSNCSSLLSGSYENFDRFWGRKDGKRVNWCGFYLHPSLFPSPKTPFSSSLAPPVLLLGPFQGRPACLEIALSSPSSRALGVCASAFLSRKTVVVPDVENHAGHIACDGVTRSEVVVPILVKGKDGVEVCVGVLDVDCEAPDAFGEEDRAGLEKVVQALNQLIAWDVW